MLTTQCPACHATLRFTPQALSATQGWARCGVCQHPFDAWEHAVMPVLQTDVGAEPAQAPELDRINDPVDGSKLDPLEGAPTPEWANSPTLEAEPLAAGSHLQRVAPTGSGYWGVAALVLTLALLAQATVWHFDRVINHMPIFGAGAAKRLPIVWMRCAHTLGGRAGGDHTVQPGAHHAHRVSVGYRVN